MCMYCIISVYMYLPCSVSACMCLYRYIYVCIRLYHTFEYSCNQCIYCFNAPPQGSQWAKSWPKS